MRSFGHRDLGDQISHGWERSACLRMAICGCSRNDSRPSRKVSWIAEIGIMPKTKEMIELFRAIGSHDLARATTLSRKLAAQHGSRGQYRAERDLLGALNGAASGTSNGHHTPVNTTWSLGSALMKAKGSVLVSLSRCHSSLFALFIFESRLDT
jgi:hypothetical protein